MYFVDRILTCLDCGEDFVFSAGEQLFFHDKQFKNAPKRCRPCKERRNYLARRGISMQSATRVKTTLECRECAKPVTVPFRPTQGRPVLCRECLWNSRQAQLSGETGNSLRELPQ